MGYHSLIILENSSIYGIKQQNRYDIEKVLSEYSDIDFMQEKRDILIRQVRELEDKKNDTEG